MTPTTSTTEPHRSRRLVAIDALRGIAVLSVVVAHLPYSASLSSAPGAGTVFPAWLAMPLSYGGFGVNLFFVISGFCIHMSRARSPAAKVNFFPFWRRRLHRLYPPYFVALLLSLIGLFVLHRLVADAGTSFAAKLGYESNRQLLIDVVVLVLLLQNWNGAGARVGNGPFWSLGIEEQLYLLYFLLLWLRSRLQWRWTFSIVFAIALGWRIVDDRLGLAHVQALSRWAEWTLGAIAADAHWDRIRLPAWCFSLPIGLLTLALGFASRYFSWVTWLHTGIYTDLLLAGAFFIIINAVTRADWGSRSTDGSVVAFFSWIGLFSYSIYLTHEPLIVAAKQLGLRLGWGTVAITALRLLFALVGGYLFFLIVESRFLNQASRTRIGGSAGTGEAPAEDRKSRRLT